MSQDKTLTGRHVALIFGGCFSVIIAVNLTLAYSAVKTFPGLEVKNSYVASQQFDRDRATQEALGWSVAARATSDRVTLSVTDARGSPVKLAALKATLGRATHIRDDLEPDFVFDGERYIAPIDLAPGNWNIRMVAEADDGTVFRQRVVLHVEREKS
ncbi:MAG: FixH family protein [Pseudomonadota bacterium]